MKNSFNQEYYENGIGSGLSLYSNYRWIPELTIPMAFRIIEEMQIKPKQRVLDYGCAKGYLVYALRLLYREAYGVDISEYAIQESEVKVKDYLSLINSSDDLLRVGTCFDHVIAKDVFEHIELEELKKTLSALRRISIQMFVVVPLGDGTKYNEPAYEFDKTHVIRQPMEWWERLFMKADFSVLKSCYRMDGIKENWKCPNGNGIFILV